MEIPPDWTISELYNKAWELVKKYKVLWIFGMAVVGLGAGGSFSSSSNFSSSSKDFDQIKNLFNSSPQTQPIPQQISQVLGASTSIVAQTLQQIITAIPIYFYIILGIELLTLIITGIVISLITQAWSNASLLQSIESALKDIKPTIRESSEKAFGSIKSLIWLQVVPGLLLFVAFFIALGLGVLGITLGGTLLKIFFGLALVVIVGAFIYWMIMLTMSQIWAFRNVVVSNQPAKQALFSGFRIVKKKFWAMVLLGLVNTILSVVIIGGPIALIVGLIIGGILAGFTSHSLATILLVVAAVLGVAVVIFFSIIPGILTAFKAAVWSIAYHKIKGKYESLPASN